MPVRPIGSLLDAIEDAGCVRFRPSTVNSLEREVEAFQEEAWEAGRKWAMEHAEYLEPVLGALLDLLEERSGSVYHFDRASFRHALRVVIESKRAGSLDRVPELPAPVAQ